MLQLGLLELEFQGLNSLVLGLQLALEGGLGFLLNQGLLSLKLLDLMLQLAQFLVLLGPQSLLLVLIALLGQV